MRKIILITVMATAFFLITLSLFTSAAIAKDIYPWKPMALVCNSQPGGGFDLFARVTSRYMTKYLRELSPGAKGGDIKIKNMPGASGLQAYMYLYKDAKTDGHTYGDFNSGALYSLLFGKDKVAFDPKNFTWLFSLTRTSRVFIGNKDGAASWEELVAKSQKEALTLLVPQFGTTAHLDCIIVKELTKLSGKIVALKGTADAVSAVLRGDGDAALVSYDSVSSICEEKKVNTLVSFTQDRILPFVPTIVEKGFPETVKHVRRAGRMYIGPPKLDPEAERLLIAAGKKMIADPDFIAFIKERKSDLEPLFGKELKDAIIEEIDDLEKWAPIFKKYGV